MTILSRSDEALLETTVSDSMIGQLFKKKNVGTITDVEEARLTRMCALRREVVRAKQIHARQNSQDENPRLPGRLQSAFLKIRKLKQLTPIEEAEEAAAVEREARLTHGRQQRSTKALVTAELSRAGLG